MRGKKALGGLEDWEVSLIKGMMTHTKEMKAYLKEVKTYKDSWTDQDILAHFSRPERTINNGRLSEIRQALESKTDTGNPAIDRFRPQPIASWEEVRAFLAAPPPFDPRTGLDFAKDELIIKAREAMMLAVQGYNSTAIRFKTETFVVHAIIAWTYLLLTYCQRNEIDCYHRNKNGEVVRTRQGKEKFMELSALLALPECPIDSEAVKANLKYLIELRHEIEHRGT